jgi:hypothetical protein
VCNRVLVLISIHTLSTASYIGARTLEIRLSLTLVNFPLPSLSISEVNLKRHQQVTQNQGLASKIPLQDVVDRNGIRDPIVLSPQFDELEASAIRMSVSPLALGRTIWRGMMKLLAYLAHKIHAVTSNVICSRWRVMNARSARSVCRP